MWVNKFLVLATNNIVSRGLPTYVTCNWNLEGGGGSVCLAFRDLCMEDYECK